MIELILDLVGVYVVAGVVMFLMTPDWKKSTATEAIKTILTTPYHYVKNLIHHD